MKKKKTSSDFLVGAVIILAAISITAAIVFVNQTDLTRRTTSVEARFRDVGNVQVGNPAVIRGVRAGRVQSVSLDSAGWVRMTIALERGAVLPQDPVVLLNESSLFGEWQATIMERTALPADRNVERLIAEADQGDLIPGATLPDIAQLTAVAGRIAGDVASVAGRFEVAFDDAAARELRASIRNFAQLSGELATAVRRQSGNLDSLSSDVRTGVEVLLGTVGTIQTIASRIDTATSGGEIRQSVTDFSRAANQFAQATLELRNLSERLSTTQRRIDEMVVNTDSIFRKINMGEGSLALLLNDPSLYVNSDSLLRDLRALIADIRANPRRYVSFRLF